MEFCRYLAPSEEEHAQRQAAIDRVSEAVTAIWPSGEVKVFGSFATGGNGWVRGWVGWVECTPGPAPRCHSHRQADLLYYVYCVCCYSCIYSCWCYFTAPLHAKRPGFLAGSRSRPWGPSPLARSAAPAAHAHTRPPAPPPLLPGLYLPTSDVDAVVVGSGCADIPQGLKALAQGLMRRKLAKNVQVRRAAGRR